jgi:ATP-dependent Lon protease
MNKQKLRAVVNPLESQLEVKGDMSLAGTIVQVRNLTECMQVAFDAGVKRNLLPMSSVVDIAIVPGELFAKFQDSFYSDPVDAVFKALGVE